MEVALEDGSLWRMVQEEDSSARLQVPVPSRALPSLTSAGASLVEGTLVVDLEEQDASPLPTRSQRLSAPRNTLFFQDPTLDAINPELRKLGDKAGLLPLEGQPAELATQLKRELARRREDPHRDSLSLADGHLTGEDQLHGARLSTLHVDGRTPDDFSKYARLTPLILDSISSRLGSLSKEEIRSENNELRDQIRGLRSEIQKRREELHVGAGSMCNYSS